MISKNHATQLATVASKPSVSTGAATRLPVRRNSRFVLGHYPTEWELVHVDNPDGKGKVWMWLPRLKKLSMTPGVNGVRRVGKKGIDTSVAEADYRKRGFTIIPNEAILQEGPHGLARGGYLVEYPAQGGTYHCCRWEVPKMLGDSCRFKTDDDPEAFRIFNEFRAALVRKGIIDAPDPDALEVVTERFQTRARRHAKDAHIPSEKALIDEQIEKIEIAKKAKAPESSHAI